MNDYDVDMIEVTKEILEKQDASHLTVLTEVYTKLELIMNILGKARTSQFYQTKKMLIEDWEDARNFTRHAMATVKNQIDNGLRLSDEDKKSIETIINQMRRHQYNE